MKKKQEPKKLAIQKIKIATLSTTKSQYFLDTTVYSDPTCDLTRKTLCPQRPNDDV